MAAAAAAASRARPRITEMKPLETNIEQALIYIRTADIDNPEVYKKICMNLGSTIDSTITRNEVPSSSHLPQLLLIVKEVYRRKTESLQPSLMLLILPIKAACQVGWFPEVDKNDLLMMVKEVRSGFSGTDKMNIEPSHAHSCVSNIISRFYPRMKVEHILTSFDVKAGYGTFKVVFTISKDMWPSYCQDLWLLVARIDNMDTAACIVSPPNVDFLINHCKVPKRTRNNMGKGPQLPSNVTKMIIYGENVLEVSGDFDGQYIIAIAYMNLISSPDPPQLQDYLHPASSGDDSDCEVIEMLSSVSLNCPISLHRIKTPVKGHLCKHPQCFDYNYFMEINSIRPTWKCPICIMPVCNLDVSIDQDFLKILNEVAKGVDDVIISSDGSWMVDMTEKSHQSTETNRNTKSQNNHIPDTPANFIFPTSSSALQNSGGLDNSVTVERTSTSTTTAVSQVFSDSRLESQGSHDMVHTPPSVQQTRHHLNPVKLATTRPSYSLTNPNHPSAQSQPRKAQTDQATQADISTSTTKKAQSTSLFTPVQLTPSATRSPHSSDLIAEQLWRKGEQRHCTLGQSHPATAMSPAPALARAPTLARAPASPSNTGPVSPTWLRKPNGDAMVAGRMRGSLKGKELAAARLQLFSPPQQPIRANEPWSIPSLTDPVELLMQQPPTNYKNVSNSGNLPQ